MMVAWVAEEGGRA